MSISRRSPLVNLIAFLPIKETSTLIFALCFEGTYFPLCFHLIRPWNIDRCLGAANFDRFQKTKL
jgi:hypothetical protein